MNETLEYALFYVSYGLSVIPLKPGEKTPLIKWEKYQEEPPSTAEVQKWFDGSNNNIAIICGKVSGNLVVIDFDDAGVYEKFLHEVESDAELKDIIGSTWLVKTGKGFHIYLRVDTDKPVKTGKLPKIDIKGEGGYVVAPPSLHPSGKHYEFVRFTRTTGHEISVITEEQYNRLLAILEKVTQSKLPEERVEKPREVSGYELTDEQIRGVVKALEPAYKQGHRHNIILYLTGWLYLKGVSYESAEKLVQAICEHYQDEECNDRLYTLRDTYGIGKTPREEKVKIEGKGLKTKNGLLDEMTKAGLSVDQATAVIAELDKLLTTQHKGDSSATERPIESFDTLMLFHDFKHGKAYVSTYKAVLVKVEKKEKKRTVTEEIPVVRIDKTYVNDGNGIKTVSLEELKTEYLEIRDLVVNVKEYPELNLPTAIYDVKISEVFREVLDFVKQRLDTAREEDQVAIVVWAIASYFIPIFKFFPYLAPLKMGYNSGGSQLLEVLKRITPRPVSISNPTPASIYWMQDMFKPTMLIDELRNNINKDTFNALYDILVAGYMKGVKIPRVLKGGDEVELFEPYGAKAVIDQSLITSQYDIASRCLFVRLLRNPHRVSDYTDSVNKELINKLYSVFLIYAPNAYSLYYNMVDSGYTGRYDQIFRPLITIARLIDQEDPSLRVEERLKVVLDDSKAFAEALLLEGDPQKKVAKLVIEYITDSLSDYMEGKTQVLPKPWHIFDEGEGEEVYIFVSDLRKKVTEYAMSLHQKDIAYRYDEGGRYAVSEREWEKVEPEIAEVLNGRQFIAILKKFFPNNVREHRKSPVFVISKDTWNKLNLEQPPTRAETEKNTPGLTRQTPMSQSTEKNSNTSKTPQFPPEFRSDCHSEIKIQNKGIEKENSKSHLELNESQPLQFTNKNTEWQLTDSAQFPLDCHSEIKLLSGNYSNSPLGKNSSAQDMTARQQQIYEFLKKLSEKVGAVMRLDKLSKDELKLLPELREKGYVNFDNKHVWLTLEGYVYLDEQLIAYISSKFLGKEKVSEEELRAILERTTQTKDQKIHDLLIKVLEERGIIRKESDGVWKVSP
jgi:hypothetical protein